MEEEIDKFLQKAGPIFFITPTAGRAIGLEKELPDFHIICTQSSQDSELMLLDGIKIFCLGKDIRNAGRILLEKETIDYIRDNSRDRVPNIVTFKPSPMIEKVCEKSGFRYLGNDWRLSRDFEDKVKFVKISSEMGIPNASSRIIKISGEVPENLLDFSSGEKYVMQFSRGYSGNSTFLIENAEELADIWKDNKGRTVKIANFRKGNTYTFDVCLGGFGILMSQPIFQITGFSQFNKNLMGTCGNDYSFGKLLDSRHRAIMEETIRKVAQKMLGLGYKGVLGFDFVAGEDGVDLIEVNPRLVGSLPVLTKLQLAAGQIPFLLLHILSFLDFDFSKTRLDFGGKEFDFSQIIIRNTGEADLTVADSFTSGIYKMDENGIFLQRRTYYADNNMSKDEFFVSCAQKGEVVGPDMEYANFQFSYGIMDNESSLKEKFKDTQEEILNKVILK